MISIRLNTIFLALSVLIASSISGIFAWGDLFFYCDANRVIEICCALDGKELYIEPEHLLGKDFKDLVDIMDTDEDTKNVILGAFNQKEKVVEVAIGRMEKLNTIQITPLTGPNGNCYVIKILQSEQEKK